MTNESRLRLLAPGYKLCDWVTRFSFILGLDQWIMSRDYNNYYKSCQLTSYIWARIRLLYEYFAIDFDKIRTIEFACFYHKSLWNVKHFSSNWKHNVRFYCEENGPQFSEGLHYKDGLQIIKYDCKFLNVGQGKKFFSFWAISSKGDDLLLANYLRDPYIKD